MELVFLKMVFFVCFNKMRMKRQKRISRGTEYIEISVEVCLINISPDVWCLLKSPLQKLNKITIMALI